jgi:hypothetical protein
MSCSEIAECIINNIEIIFKNRNKNKN